MTDHDWILKRSTDELLNDFARPVAEPGSVVDNAMRAVLAVRIAEMQRDAAKEAVTWAKWTAISTGGATVIALAALLVAVL